MRENVDSVREISQWPQDIRIQLSKKFVCKEIARLLLQKAALKFCNAVTFVVDLLVNKYACLVWSLNALSKLKNLSLIKL